MTCTMRLEERLIDDVGGSDMRTEDAGNLLPREHGEIITESLELHRVEIVGRHRLVTARNANSVC